MKKSLLIGALALVIPFTAFADGGSCVSPVVLDSLSVDSGTTCGGELGVNMGGSVFPHPSKVYQFTINQAGPGGAPTNIALSGATREAAISTSCSAAPMVICAPGVMDCDVSTLANGTYIMVVSTDSGIPVQPAPGVCGDFGITAGVLPVSLQNFSVE